MIDHIRAIGAPVVEENNAGARNALVEIRKRWFSQLGSGFACPALQENRPA